jgi:hypothetical protein
MALTPGPVVIFGSGESSPGVRAIYERIFKELPQPVNVAVLETPAGFEPNSPQVAGQIKDFFQQRLPHHRIETTIIAARKRGTPFSPDSAEVVAPLYHADVTFVGAGSPTYAVRQLQDSLAWQVLVARNRLGALSIFASAATLALSRYTIPIYEIYKVGEDIHWKQGLDFFGTWGLSLVIVPHWNNNSGGADLDTSRCYMGQERFAALLKILPEAATVIGVDERTALLIDPQNKTCRVMGSGGVTVIKDGREQVCGSEGAFSILDLGPFVTPVDGEGLPAEIWQQAQESRTTADSRVNSVPTPSAQVMRLVEERQTARARKDWTASDALRAQLLALGWRVLDTPDGPVLEPCGDLSKASYRQN